MRRLLTRSTFALVAVVLAAGPALPAADPARDRQWGLEQVGAPEAWAVGRGKGIVVAIVDSGVSLGHEDLAGKLVPGRDFVDDDATPADGEGHGTHVAGIAAAAAGNGRGIAGVAPGARIMPVRVLDDDGTGNARDVADGIRWAVDRGAKVVNLSLGDLGQPLFGPAFAEALRYAWSRGAIPVVAAGNDYLLSSGYGDEPAIVVSATDRREQKPAYSSGVGGARWGIAAPGGSGGVGPREDNVFSTYPGGYAYLAGTSMAAPHVAGAAAILRSLGLTPQQTVDRLLSTAKDIGPAGRDATFGSGRLDVAAAVRGLRRASTASGNAGGGSGGPGASAVPPARRATTPPSAANADPGAEPPAAATTQPPNVGPGAGRDLPAEEDTAGEGVPMAVWVTGLITALLAVLIGWALFRPTPPD